MKKISQQDIPHTHKHSLLWCHLGVSHVTITLDLKLHYLHEVFREHKHSCSRKSQLLLAVFQEMQHQD